MTADTYRRLEEALSAAGAPIVSRFAAGHPDPDGAFRAGVPGYEFDPALSEWWRWHDGAHDPRPRSLTSADSFIGSQQFLSVGAALESRRQRLRTAEWALEEAPWLLWAPGWLPLTEHQDDALVADLSRSRSRPARILLVPVETPAPEVRVVADSWATVARWWTEMLLSGATTWTESGWQVYEELVPEHLRLNPVARSVHPTLVPVESFPPLGDDIEH